MMTAESNSKTRRKLIDDRAEKLLGITNRTDRIADVLHQHIGLMDGRMLLIT